MHREANWSRSSFSWGTFRCKRPNATLAASSEFDQPLMIGLASSRILELGARLWKVSRPPGQNTVLGLLHILIDPIDPVVVYVGFPHGRIVGKVRRHRNGDEFYDDTVVLQRVVERVSAADRYVGVAGVVQDQRRRGDGAGIGDRRLFLPCF